jgi:hypothetical protein
MAAVFIVAKMQKQLTVHVLMIGKWNVIIDTVE